MKVTVGNGVSCKNVQGTRIEGIITKINHNTVIVNHDFSYSVVRIQELKALGYDLYT